MVNVRSTMALPSPEFPPSDAYQGVPTFLRQEARFTSEPNPLLYFLETHKKNSLREQMVDACNVLGISVFKIAHFVKDFFEHFKEANPNNSMAAIFQTYVMNHLIEGESQLPKPGPTTNNPWNQFLALTQNETLETRKILYRAITGDLDLSIGNMPKSHKPLISRLEQLNALLQRHYDIKGIGQLLENPHQLLSWMDNDLFVTVLASLEKFSLTPYREFEFLKQVLARFTPANYQGLPRQKNMMLGFDVYQLVAEKLIAQDSFWLQYFERHAPVSISPLQFFGKILTHHIPPAKVKYILKKLESVFGETEKVLTQHTLNFALDHLPDPQDAIYFIRTFCRSLKGKIIPVFWKLQLLLKVHLAGSPAILNTTFNTEVSLQEIENLQNMHEQIAHVLDYFDYNLNHVIEAAQGLPLANFRTIFKIRNLAIKITDLIERDSRRGSLVEMDYYRKEIHNRFSRGALSLTRTYIDKYSKSGSLRNEKTRKKLLSHLHEINTLLQDIFNPRFDKKSMEMFRPLLKFGFDLKIKEPLVDLPLLAVKIRATWQGNKTLSKEEKMALALLAINIQNSLFALASVTPEEINTPFQAKKMASLVLSLYGSGYGDDSWALTANELNQLASHWDPQSALRQLALLASQIKIMVSEVIDSYHRHFDPLALVLGDMLGIANQERSDFAAEQYRSMAVMTLSNHVQALAPEGGNKAATKAVLDFKKNGPAPDIPYQPYFFSHPLFPDDKRTVGGKAHGLHYLAKTLPHKTPAGFVLPARPAHYRLSAEDKASIQKAITQLIWQNNHHPLAVSVRSGAAISMPGAMQTLLNISDLDALYQAIETVYQSWDHPEARNRRLLDGIPDEWGTAVSIVQMIDATQENSGSGVALSTGMVRYALGKRGTQLVDGHDKGNDPLPPALQAELMQDMAIFESDFKSPVEVEFTVSQGRLYYLQIRAIQLAITDAIKWHARKITDDAAPALQAIRKMGGFSIFKSGLTQRTTLPDASLPKFTGHTSLGQPVKGYAAFSQTDVLKLKQELKQPVLLSPHADAREVASLAVVAGAIATAGGNAASHLMGVARSAGLSLVSGFEFEWDEDRVTKDGVTIHTGDPVTLDPLNNNLVSGHLQIVDDSSLSDEADLVLAEARDEFLELQVTHPTDPLWLMGVRSFAYGPAVSMIR